MQKTVLYAVLNWGLGHASRSIPIIKYLLKQNHKLIICSDGDSLHLLKKEFDTAIFEETDGYNAFYSVQEKHFFLSLAKQIPKFVKAIKQEHKLCAELCKQYEVDAIISDNRYGFYHKSIPSAFICHQTYLSYPPSSIAEKIVNSYYRNYLDVFTEIWVPDLAPPENLSGKMSSGDFNIKHFIGIDSRFKPQKAPIKYQFLALLSGPEPQRTLLEKKLLEQLSKIEGKHLLIRGAVKQSNLNISENISVIDLAASNDLEQLIAESDVVICRSGYTSIMDLLKLGKKAILIPTPGQPEQEFLAENTAKKNWFTVQKQDTIDLTLSLRELSFYSLPALPVSYNYSIISKFLDLKF